MIDYGSLVSKIFLAAITAGSGFIAIKSEFLDPKPMSKEELRDVTISVMRQVLNEHNGAPPYTPFSVTQSVTPDGAVKVEFEFQSFETRINFDVGEGQFEDDYRRAKVANIAARFVSVLRDSEIRDAVSVVVDFMGSTDGIGELDYFQTPFKSLIGPIRIENPILNGRIYPSQVYKSGDRINNKDLSLIRAYSMFYHFMNFLHDDQRSWVNTWNFLGSTNSQIGQEYRFGKVIVKIYPQEGQLSH